MSTVWNLPDEVTVDILSRLPAKSVLGCRCVCKPWRKLTTNPHFVKMHQNRANEKNPSLILTFASSLGTNLYSIDSEALGETVELNLPTEISPSQRISVVGSCKGLLCFSDNKSFVSLWNPATKEYMKLPDAPVGKNDDGPVLGFGYNLDIEEYNVVRIVYSCNAIDSWDIPELDKSEVKVYTIGSDSWRRIRGVPCRIGHSISAAHLNGMLHWIGTCGTEFKFSKLLLSFNVGNEEFREVPLPEFDDGKKADGISLGIIEGYLSTFVYFLFERVDIWVMKDYGVKESWTILFSIGGPMVVDYFNFIEPLVIQKHGEILVQVNNRKLVLYNPENKMVRDPCIRGVPVRFKTNTYVESLTSIASLMAGNGVDEQQ